MSFFHLLFAFQIVWNIYLYLLPIHTLPANYWFNIAYGSTSFFTGFIILWYVRRQHGGGVASSMTYLAAAAFSFGLGILNWSYYNIFLGIPTPFPSTGDFFFILYPPLLAIGTFKLLRFYTSGLNLRVIIEAIILFFVTAIPSYYFLLVGSLVSTPSSAVRFVVLGVLVGTCLIVSLVYLIIRVGGGKFRKYWLLYGGAYLLLITADFLFQFRSDRGIYWNGDVVDTLFAAHSYLFALATIFMLSTLFFQPDQLTVSGETAK